MCNSFVFRPDLRINLSKIMRSEVRSVHADNERKEIQTVRHYMFYHFRFPTFRVCACARMRACVRVYVRVCLRCVCVCGARVCAHMCPGVGICNHVIGRNPPKRRFVTFTMNLTVFLQYLINIGL